MLFEHLPCARHRAGWWGGSSQVEDTCVATAVASVDQENGSSRGNSRRTPPGLQQASLKKREIGLRGQTLWFNY